MSKAYRLKKIGPSARLKLGALLPENYRLEVIDEDVVREYPVKFYERNGATYTDETGKTYKIFVRVDNLGYFLHWQEHNWKKPIEWGVALLNTDFAPNHKSGIATPTINEQGQLVYGNCVLDIECMLAEHPMKRTS